MSDYALHPETFIDTAEIPAYIGQDSTEVAHGVVGDIYRAIQRVAPFPNSGHRRTDLTNRPLRFIRVRDYLIAMRLLKSRCG